MVVGMKERALNDRRMRVSQYNIAMVNFRGSICLDDLASVYNPIPDEVLNAACLLYTSDAADD